MTVRVNHPVSGVAVRASRLRVGDLETANIDSRQRNAARGFSAVRLKTVVSQCMQYTYLYALVSLFSRALVGSYSVVFKAVLPAVLIKLWALGLVWSDSSLGVFFRNPLLAIKNWLVGASPKRAAVAVAWSLGAFGAQVAHADVIGHEVAVSGDVAAVECAVEYSDSVLEEFLNVASPLVADVPKELRINLIRKDLDGRASGPVSSHICSYQDLLASPRGPPLGLDGVFVSGSQRLRGGVWFEPMFNGADSNQSVGVKSFRNLKNFVSRDWHAAGEFSLVAELVATFLFIAKEQKA